MSYKATVIIEELDRTTIRATAEGAWFHLLWELLHGTTKFEITNNETGETKVIELDYHIEDDVTVSRHMMLIMIASKYLTDEQKNELDAWEKENLDGRDIATTDWEGWEKIIGQKQPKKFRRNIGLES